MLTKVAFEESCHKYMQFFQNSIYLFQVWARHPRASIRDDICYLHKRLLLKTWLRKAELSVQTETFRRLLFRSANFCVLKKITLFKFMERLHNRNIKIHKCEMTPAIFARVHASRLIGFLLKLAFNHVRREKCKGLEGKNCLLRLESWSWSLYWRACIFFFWINLITGKSLIQQRRTQW